MKRIEVKRNKRKGLIFDFKEIRIGMDVAGGRYLCRHACSYGLEIYTELPDPRYGPKRYSQRFSDFCGAVDIYNDVDLIPASGTLERYYGKIIEKIKLKK